MSMRHTTTLDNPDMVRYRRSRSLRCKLQALSYPPLIASCNQLPPEGAAQPPVLVPEHGACTTRGVLKLTTYH